MRIIYLLILSLISFNGINIFAQKERNNIYLFDCTGSMKKNNLWQPAKSALDSTIKTQISIPGSEYSIIPFGDNAYEIISFYGQDYTDRKQTIDDALNKYIAQAKFTNISDAFKTGFSKIDPNKDNRIYLLTDGMPNGGDTPEKVAETINSWCIHHRNCRLFYVALTNGVVNPVIKQAINNCNDAYIVQCEDEIIPQIADISSDIYTNLEELGKIKNINFSLPGNYQISIDYDDELFNVNPVKAEADNGKISVSFSPKNGLDISQIHQILQGEIYEFPIIVRCVNPHFFIANPLVTVHISDVVPSELFIGQGKDEIGAGKVTWYDSFLWSDASPSTKVEWNLDPKFINRLPQSSMEFSIEPVAGQPNDYTVWYNGELLNNGQTFVVSPDKASVIQIMFNHDAFTGKRYFNLVPVKTIGVDMVNGLPLNDYVGTTLRTEYDVTWNPLKACLFWLGIILLAALILWFLLLKRIFFPLIKMSKVEVTGPNTYYATKKLKGARKVVLTSKKKSQNIFSRIFTGEIRYLRAEHFSPDIIILPAGRKKKVKLHSQGKLSNSWDVFPSTIFNQYDKGSITNKISKEKSNIEFS